jgi:hypothetical protein
LLKSRLLKPIGDDTHIINCSKLLDKVGHIGPWTAQWPSGFALEATVGHELTFRVLFADSDQPANIRPPSRVFDQVDGSRKRPDVTSYITLSYCWHYTSWQLAVSLMYDPWHWMTTHVQDSILPVTLPMLSTFLGKRKTLQDLFGLTNTAFGRRVARRRLLP